MTPKFAKAIDPIFLFGIDFAERINRGEEIPAETAHLKFRSLFEEAEAILGGNKDWTLSKYAIVSWIDELLVEAPWSGRDWWGNNVLEVHYFNSRLCNEQFFAKAKEASILDLKDALEVYFDCVILGFRGFYADQQTASQIASSRNLPATLEEWMDKTSRAIRLGQGRPPLSEAVREIPGAPPLISKKRVVSIWTIAVLFVLVDVIFFIANFVA
ncbi:DotU family type IV/VI secretion system protein [Rubinisphaera italica]|uniref:Type IV / VI secretion system DotU domain-containing protein n=1 Tax=Rubinisphaera italica TaxID=2527969 RepID=A0A5C5XN43_9PLAN|nr:DotU family type IV/VI secretion system protein [Rubinisphaera italica]TWT63999.1 hypothetical protein Pan54_47590 [Rubinisphaera italica]